jgi:flagellar biosynthesis protein FliR
VDAAPTGVVLDERHQRHRKHDVIKAMSIEISSQWLWLVILCMLRLTPVLAFTPLLGGFPVPRQARVMLILGLAACIVTVHMPAAAPMPASVGRCIVAAVAELLTGGLLAFGIHCLFAIWHFAGQLMDVQMGLAIGSIFDPVSRRPSPLLASALSTAALATAFTFDLHHEVMRAFALGLEATPLGSALRAPNLGSLAGQVALVYAEGLALAAPVVFVLFLMDVGLAIMSRSIPQLNVLFVGLPIKIVVGMGILLWMLPHWTPLIVHAARQLLVVDPNP